MLLEVFIFQMSVYLMVLSEVLPSLFEESDELASFMDQVNTMTFACDFAVQTIEDEAELVLAIGVFDLMESEIRL